MTQAKKALLEKRLGPRARNYAPLSPLQAVETHPSELSPDDPAAVPFHEGAIGHIWKRRTSCGQPRIFQSPQEMIDAAEKYFEWADENPLQEARVTSYLGEQVDLKTTKMRAMSIRALCLFVGISHMSWYKYCEREEFVFVTSQISDVIYNQKFEGAAAELLNALIISRDLGLAERTDITSGGESVTEITRRIVRASDD